MNFPCKAKDWVIQACLAALICGLSGVATPSNAQNAHAPTDSGAASIAASTTQGAEPAADETLRKRVQGALHADPYFYDEHVTVSIEDGAVVLRGFVFSSWDLQMALSIARKAAGDTKVVDYLSIQDIRRR